MKRGRHRGVEAVLLQRAAATLKTLSPKAPFYIYICICKCNAQDPLA